AVAGAGGRVAAPLRPPAGAAAPLPPGRLVGPARRGLPVPRGARPLLWGFAAGPPLGLEPRRGGGLAAPPAGAGSGRPLAGRVRAGARALARARLARGAAPQHGG